MSILRFVEIVDCKHKWFFNEKGYKYKEYWLQCSKCRQISAVKLKGETK